MKMDATTWSLIGAVAVAVFLYDYWKKSYFRQRGIPSEGAMPFVGHYHQMISKGFVYLFADMGKLPNKVQGIFFGGTPTIVVNCPDMAKEIMIRNFSHFHNRSTEPLDDYPLNKGLQNLRGARWKQVRNILTPAFSAGKMKPIATLLNNSCDSLIKHLNISVASNPNIEVKSMFGNFTMDCIAKAGFGLQVDTQGNPDNPFIQNAKPFVTFSFYSPMVLVSVLLPQLAPIFNYLNIGNIPNKSKQFFLDVTRKVLSLRQDEGSKRVDILQLMVDAHRNSNSTAVSNDIPELAGEQKNVHRKTELSDAEIMAQSLLFFVVGYETTNVSLSCLAYNLATHPEMQDRLFEEVQGISPDRDSVTYDTVNKMEYLDVFISETLRLHPPGVLADRVCEESIEVGGYQFDKGVDLLINVIGLHLNPNYWEDPEKFDPERFTKEAKEKRHPFAYLPFGNGPRNCIGMRFALLLLKMAMVRLVQNFKFEPCKKTQIPMQYGSSQVTPDDGIMLRVVARD